MLSGRQHADTTLIVDHAAPHCESRELFKTVIDDEATGVFQGKIIVPPHAQKTDGRMMSAALLLSEGGAMNNKPELEIFADDVQCAHGATCGQLDEDLLFYLMARGLPQGGGGEPPGPGLPRRGGGDRRERERSARRLIGDRRGLARGAGLIRRRTAAAH